MRTIVLALGCCASVLCGALLARFNGPLVPSLGLALAVLALIWLRSLAPADPVSRAGAGPRWRLAAASLVVIGLARGASVGPPLPAQVPERGSVPSPAGGPLREFEVVGASEPGVRCVIELRDPQAPRHPSLRVSAPPERCPLAAGQRVAILAPSLQPSWRDGLSDREHPHDLGRGPVVWLRPSPAPTGLARISVGYWERVAALRQWAWTQTRGDPSASLVVAVGLGLRSALAPEQREQLRAAGLGHLIAVSGLHVAVAALGLQALARRAVALLGGAPRWACLLAWIPLWGYVGLTGAAPSAIRAALMLTGIDLAALVGRPRHGPTLLASTAAAMLLWQPAWLFEPGFALSLAAMAAIVSAPRELGVLAMSWRITWTTAPLSVLWFDVAPLHGLIGNAFALPLFALLMPLALVAVIGPGSIGELALSLAKLCATPILDLAAILAKLPSAGPTGLLVLAGLALIIRRRIRADRPHPWLPPKLACVLALVVALIVLVRAEIDHRRVVALDFDWVALGSVHSRSLLVADRSAPNAACLYRPTVSSATWIALFELLGVRQLTRIDADLPQADPSLDAPPLDPRTRALIEQLDRAGIGTGRDGHCEPPAAARVRDAIRACGARSGGAPVLLRSKRGQISCRIEDRWVLAPELAEPPCTSCINPGWTSPSPD